VIVEGLVTVDDVPHQATANDVLAFEGMHYHTGQSTEAVDRVL
jgi:hypothetical protein